jgi:nucleoside-diphosphate-sugar epimerase
VKVLVTGAGGFLGGRTVKMLLEEGREVRALHRRKPAAAAASPRLEAVEGQLGDLPSLRAAVRGVQAVVHCAAKNDLGGSLSFFLEHNLLGTAHLLEAARAEGVRFFVLASSASVVFSPGDLRGVDETAPYMNDPTKPYAYSKTMAERLTLAANGPAFKTLALRPHLIWGPGDRHLLPRLLTRARRGRLRLFSGGPYLVDATYIDNAARAFELALSKLAAGAPVDGQAFFIAQGEPQDINLLVNRLLAAVGAPPAKAGMPKALGRAAAAGVERLWKTLRRQSEPPVTLFAAQQLSSSHWFNLDKAKTMLGYRPEVSVAEGLRRLAAWRGSGSAESGREGRAGPRG